ncbi:class I SAM-dependent methyltransferase [Marinicella rhabdoformis]|uniref:class I SAM-dependent methyltransferase n=1 Tax=Marinicella rhabdoformis TaxID=2580566 RepID=UPI0012AECB0B|nr:SAM-dependent methyltransferase [Marinicella rhabdoformis]
MTSSAQQISNTLQHKITQEINNKGSISFARFMEMALYHPGLGYYSAGLKKFGKEGDFITSPELGSLFAQSHAQLFQPVLEKHDDAVIFELGAGMGSFCHDLLLALDKLDQLPQAYWILEVSADLKHQQQQKIAQLPNHLADKVMWLDGLPEQPFNGVIFGNEVLDALPVEVFRYQNNEYHRLMLKNDNDLLSESWQPFSSELAQQLNDKKLNLPNGYRSEFIPNLNQWLTSVTTQLQSGLIWWVDYGYGAPAYYHPQRNEGTLVCHQRHEANFNPYQSVGLQDITAFVDFTHVAECLSNLDCEVKGFGTQADVLMAAGIDKLLQPEGDFVDYYQLASEMKQLMLPTEMGEKFKVLAATKNHKGDISGFENNRLYDL